MVECAALEMRYTGNRIEGSNPSLSATCVEKLVQFAGPRRGAYVWRNRVPMDIKTYTHPRWVGCIKANISSTVRNARSFDLGYS